MTRTFKQRLVYSLSSLLVSAAVGVACGYLLGCALALRQAYGDMSRYANNAQERANVFLGEATGLLTAVSAAHLSSCSDAALSRLRSTVFRAQFVHDIGHIQNGKIDCSATLGRLRRPIKAPPITHTETFGGNTYLHSRNYPSLEPGTDNVGFQVGDYYAVYSQFRFAGLGPADAGFYRILGSTQPAFVKQQMSGILDVDQYVLDRNGKLWKNGYLFVTRCSAPPERPACTTAYIPLRKVFLHYRAQTQICILAGLLGGLLLGLYSIFAFRRSLGLEKQLRRAIRKNKVQAVYQPIVDLESGRIVEAEALARWTDEDGFAVSPATFVPIAEQSGFIGELTELVIRQALSDLSPLLKHDPGFRVNVNISAKDLADERFPTMLEDALRQAGVSPENLALEVTESSTAQSLLIQQTIRQLHERGHSIQIDDFGTGYSSLSYLHNLAIDAIKIDRAFTQTIGTEAVTAGILPQILAMAESLKLQVIAEGIETPEQAAYFAARPVNVFGQGWLFGRPMPAEELQKVIAQAHAPSAAR
jgi:sensor c-di-GMP phosphodiesterase-like protein